MEHNHSGGVGAGGGKWSFYVRHLACSCRLYKYDPDEDEIAA